MMRSKYECLIMDLYSLWKQGGAISCLMYGSLATVGFSDISSMENYLDAGTPDMIYIKSVKTGKELDVYEWEFKDYEIDDAKKRVTVKTNNNKIKKKERSKGVVLSF